MRLFRLFVFCCAFLFLAPGTGTAADFQCAFEKDHNPPVDENSEAHKLYLQARELENAKPECNSP